MEDPSVDVAPTTSRTAGAVAECVKKSPFIRLDFSNHRSLSNKSLLLLERNRRNKALNTSSLKDNNNNDDCSIKSLGSSVSSGLRNSFKSMDNMRAYLRSCNVYDDMQTLQLCATRCSQRITEIKSNSLLLKDMDAAFLLDIITMSSLRKRKQHDEEKKDEEKKTKYSTNKIVSLRVSRLVATFCTYHIKQVTASVFQELTLPEYMPVVSSSVALSLLILEATLIPESETSTTRLSCLQNRCLTALATTSWDSKAHSSSTLSFNDGQRQEASPRRRDGNHGKTVDADDTNSSNDTNNDLSKDVLRKLPKIILIELLSRPIKLRGTSLAHETVRFCCAVQNK